LIWGADAYTFFVRKSEREKSLDRYLHLGLDDKVILKALKI